MKETNELRIKSAMIVFELEASLGNYIKANVNVYEHGWLGWADIKLGMKLAIKYESLSTNEKATSATEIVDIYQYVI